MKLRHKNAAFTLLEMSIVIVIITLLVAGIFAGRSLMEASALQSVISDYDKYRRAALLFKDKYKELPGDFTGATALWGTNPLGCPPSASDTARTETCNGDGDGFVGDTRKALLNSDTKWHENLQFWQHLSNAALIKEKYSGGLSTANNGVSLGINLPKTAVKNGRFTFTYYSNYNLSANVVFGKGYNHVFILGAHNYRSESPPMDLIADFSQPGFLHLLTGSDAKFVDSKIDDGKPGTGKVQSFVENDTWVPCANSSDATTAVYNSTSTPICSLIFITGF